MTRLGHQVAGFPRKELSIKIISKDCIGGIPAFIIFVNGGECLVSESRGPAPSNKIFIQKYEAVIVRYFLYLFFFNPSFIAL